MKTKIKLTGIMLLGIIVLGTLAAGCTPKKTETVTSTPLTDFEIDGTTLVKYIGNATGVVIPSIITEIGYFAFKDCKSLTSVTIPSSVTTIEFMAFAETNLTSIDIPSSVTTIGVGAFAYCASLTSVTIPSSVTTIGNGAFRDCSSLTSVTIPSSVTAIGDHAFQDCTTLTSVTLSSGTRIGDEAFDQSVRIIYRDGTQAEYSEYWEDSQAIYELELQTQVETAQIELTSPRMNGPEIVALQERLLFLGFSEIGEADGYYGPLAEGVIKNIQAFSGFKPNPGDSDLIGLPYWEQNSARFLPNGKVNRALWDFIFDDAHSSLLRNISTVLNYDPSGLFETNDFEESTEEKYVSIDVSASTSDLLVKIIRFRESIIRGNVTEITYYLVNNTYYFIHYKVTDAVEGLYSELETYLVNNNTIFKMVNGIPQPYDDTALIQLKNDILSKHVYG